jgi:hypothetical protein
VHRVAAGRNTNAQKAALIAWPPSRSVFDCADPYPFGCRKAEDYAMLIGAVKIKNARLECSTAHDASGKILY